jgi:hypothetical protein
MHAAPLSSQTQQRCSVLAKQQPQYAMHKTLWQMHAELVQRTSTVWVNVHRQNASTMKHTSNNWIMMNPNQPANSSSLEVQAPNSPQGYKVDKHPTSVQGTRASTTAHAAVHGRKPCNNDSDARHMLQ